MSSSHPSFGTAVASPATAATPAAQTTQPTTRTPTPQAAPAVEATHIPTPRAAPAAAATIALDTSPAWDNGDGGRQGGPLEGARATAQATEASEVRIAEVTAIHVVDGGAQDDAPVGRVHSSVENKAATANPQISYYPTSHPAALIACPPPASCMHPSVEARRPPRASSSLSSMRSYVKSAGTLVSSPGEAFEDDMLSKYFCGTTCALNPELHSPTLIRAMLVSDGVRFSALFMETLLAYWFGGTAGQFRVREVHEKVFEFQTASADVAAEIILSGKRLAGPICMLFECASTYASTVDTLHACHTGSPLMGTVRTAMNLNAKFHGGRPTCSASTQSPARRDDSRQSGAAQAFQYNTEKAATSGNGNKNYTVSPTTQGNRVTATFGVRQKFQPQSEIIADQLAPLSSSDTREPRPLCTSKEGNAVQVNEGSLQCTRLSAGQSSAVSNMGLSLTRAPASCPLVHSPASSTPAPTTQHRPIRPRLLLRYFHPQRMWGYVGI
jgi:hypothetical protein